MKNIGTQQINLRVLTSAIGVMAALLILFTSAFANGKVEDPKTQELNSVKQIGLALLMYTTDCDDLMPPAVGVAKGEPAAYFMLIQPYLKSFSVFESPFDTVSESVGFTSTKTGRISFGVNTYLMPHYLDAIPINYSELVAPEKTIAIAAAPQFFGQKDRTGVLPPQPCALLGRVSETSYVTKYPNNWMNIGNMVGIPENNLSFTSKKPLADLLENKDAFVSWSGDRTAIGMADGRAYRTQNPKLLISIQADKAENLWDPYRKGCAP